MTAEIPQETVTRDPIAIVGIGCVLPDAPDAATFWDNLLAGRSSIREVPRERWDPDLFWDADKDAPEKTYAKIGAFVADDAFDGITFRMPPKVVEQVDPSQRWALSATREALLDGGYATGIKGDAGREFDRSRCAVILGNAMGGEQMKLQTKNAYWPQVERALRQDADFAGLPPDTQTAVLARAKERYQAGVPPITEDSMPGALSNVAAGRIANVFDLGGKNFTTDAACASSFAALDAAVDTLADGESDMVIWGGTDRSMDVTPYVEFSKIGALSPDGSRPFDKDANGFVMGEGCAIFVLKRLSDAERDGDKVYAIVRGIGASSDGKGKGITAPNPRGQVLAVRRAYEDAGIDPYTIGYLEAHGTSTPVGDPVELQSVQEAFAAARPVGTAAAGNGPASGGASTAAAADTWSSPRAAPGSILVGSVKSNLGHLKSAAGAAGILKAALALKHGVVPPSINVRVLNPRIDWAQSPFKVATARTDWPRPAGLPRRAAVSSFGFGGTNFHVVLEEHIPGRIRIHKKENESLVTQHDPSTEASPVPATAGHVPAASPAGHGTPAATATGQATPATAASHGTSAVHGTPAAAGHAATTPASGPAQTAFDLAAFRAHMQARGGLEAEPLVLDADDAAQALATLAAPVTYDVDGEGERIRNRFAPYTRKGLAAERRVGVAVQGPTELPKKLALAQKAAADPAAAKLAFNQGVFLGQGAPAGKVAFLFPGQGTQYVNMGRDLAAKYAVVQHTFEEADEALFDELDGVKLTDILWPDPDTPEARAKAEEKLRLTEYTQPAVLAMDVALLRLLKQWGIEPDVVAGHSLGEYGALVAAGVMRFEDALHAVAARGREMAHVDVPDLGKMAAVAADWETVQKAIADVAGYVIPANKNCPGQTVLAGSSDGVDAAVAALKAQGLDAQYLPVSAAFHSDIVAPASAPLRKVLERLDVQPPRVRCLSNVGARPYPDDPTAIRDNLATQIAHPVEWIDIMEKMYDEGVRTFIEVGPKRALTGFALDILGAKGDAVAICSNHPKKGGIQHVNELYAFLGAWGFRPQLPDLDDGSVYTPEFRDPAAPFRALASSSTASAAPSTPGAADHTSPGLDGRLDVITDGLRTIVRQLETMNGIQKDHAVVTASPAPSEQALRARIDAFGINLEDIGISGVSVGLPGTDKPLFADDDWDRILRGDNLIDPLPEHERRKLTDKNITRLVKSGSGEATFQVVKDIAQVIQLAGRRGDFDIRQWGIDGDLASVLDRSFQYAMAAGLEALRDAGIPLQRTYFQTSTGSFLPKEWKLPEPLRDDTGIIFASAFPGYDNLIRELSRYLADKYAGRTLDDLQDLYQSLIDIIEDPQLREKVQESFDAEFEKLQDVLPPKGGERYQFNRKFLFQVLSMGHAQLAQWIGARGPNTQLNAACASTTQAVAVAEDWIRTGRARRVLVVGADDVTSDAMFEWIGAGFLASGAATTKKNVADAALPFDARRHGMIVGMGAVGMLVETAAEVEARGMRPIAKLLSTRIANSAFHGSRLDVDHIASEMQALVAQAAARYGIAADAIAPQTVFMSHETYTPARGGSASAEIHALRAAFGDQANQVVIANTKGFTGHPQGAGIEDAIALKCLQRGQVPPIANFRDPDPELGDLNLSKGGDYDVRFALRLAAGFGSQVAMTLTELVARETERVASEEQYKAWLSAVSGYDAAETEVEHRTLRIIDQGPPKRTPQAPIVAEPELAAAVVHAPATTTEGAGRTAEPAEAQALPAAPIPSAPVSAPPAPAAPTPASPTPAAPPAATPASPATADEPPAGTEAAEGDHAPAILEKLIGLVAEQTGYPTDMLDPDLDMEADLGIDTVKQAELFGMLRQTYDIPQEEGLQIKDYPTLRKVAGYFASRVRGAPTTPPADGAAGTGTATSAPTPAAAPSTAPPHSPEETGGPDPTPVHAAAPVHAAMSEADGAEPAASSTAGGGDAQTVLARLVALVADKTGYPAEMLDPDLDMEADLGIDTVKQAELFGILRETYDLPQEEGLQIKDYPTMRAVAGYIADRLGPGAAAPAASTPVAEEEPAPAAGGQAPMTAPDATGQTRFGEEAAKAVPADVAGDGGAATPAADEAAAPTTPDATELGPVLEKVTALVAKKTGYPAEMLEPDLDMEADLGIDTVKQAELFGQVRETFGIPPVDGLQLKDYPTLKRVAEFVLQQQTGGAPSAATADAVQPDAAVTTDEVAPDAATAATQTAGQPERAEPAAHPILRRAPLVRPMTLPSEENDLPRGRILLIGPEEGRFTTPWKEAGFEVRTSVGDDGPIAGILCLALEPGRCDDLVGELFDAAKRHQDDLRGGMVCVVTQQDGAHGLRDPREPAMAALAGLGKALRKEFPDALVKVIDLDPAMQRRGTAVVEEVLQGGRRTEVAYDGDGVRYVIDVAPEDLSAGELDVSGRAFVVSGGAQGITVEMLLALAPQGPRFLLLGRTDLPPEAETWAAWGDADWAEARDAAIAHLKDQGDKVTPVAVERALSPMRKAAEVQRNLQRLMDAGAEVLYAPVDVTDAERVRKAVAWAREHFGQIDGVIHAAGLEISKDISQKDRAQFDQVYGVKQKGFDALMAATADDDLQWLCGFSSVAGRFGNIGQTDYAAGNEMLAKGVKLVASERSIPCAFTIAWGPWGEVGMATRGSIMQIMEASGVTPIPTAAGVEAFLHELATPGVRESVVAGELGAIDVDGQVVDAPWDPVLAEAQAIVAATPERFRLIDRIDALEPGRRIEATLRVDQARDPYLRDHAIQGVPYLPGVFGIEVFAEAARILAPDDERFVGANDIRFASPLKQLKDRPVEATVTVVRDDPVEEDLGSAYRCRLTTRFVAPDGKVHGEPRLHFEATLRFGVPPQPLQADEVPACDGTWTRTDIYPPFFHGPGFQVLDAAGPLTDDESMGVLRLPDEPNFQAGPATYQSHPMVTEALFQVCGLRTMVQEQVMSLPAAIQQLDSFTDDLPEGPVQLWAQFTGETRDGLRQFNGAAVGADGRVVLRLLGYTMVETGPLPAPVKVPKGTPAAGAPDDTEETVADTKTERAARAATAALPESEAHATGAAPASAAAPRQPVSAHAPVAEAVEAAHEGAAPSGSHPATSAMTDDTPPEATADGQPGGPPAAAPAEGAGAEEIPGIGMPLPEVDGITFTAVAVQSDGGVTPDWFTPNEREVHETLQVPKRRDEWRAGRLAIKKAIVASVPDLALRDVEVANDPNTRRPFVKVRGEAVPLQVSLTHRDGMAIAAIGQDPVGIDLEVMEDRDEAFYQEAFSDAEQKHLQGSKNRVLEATCMWAAKEAAFKRAGTGLAADLRAHQVRAHGEGGAVVVGPLGTFGIRFYDMEGRVLAVSVPAFDPRE